MTKEELGTLVLNSQDSLYRVAKSILRDDDDCNDAIHEAIANAYSNIQSLKKDKYAKTWLTRILINECYQILKKQSKNLPLDEQSYLIDYTSNEDYYDLYNAIMNLKNELRMCIVLYYVEGYKIKEIAKILDTTESAVKKRLVRGREKLKIDLEGGKEIWMI